MKKIGTVILFLLAMAAEILAQNSSLIPYKIIRGVRVIENRIFTTTLTIQGSAWDGAVIQNNVFRGVKGIGLDLRDVRHLKVLRNEFSGIESYAIRLKSVQTRGTDHVLIEGNFFRDIGGDAILSGEPNTNLRIIRNDFRNAALNRKGPRRHALYLKGPGFLVERNTIQGVASANGISVRTSGIVRGNFVRGAAGAGVKYHSSSKMKGDGTLVIENNMLVDNREGGLEFSAGDGVKVGSVVVRFNTLVKNGKGIFVDAGLREIEFRFYGNTIFSKAAGKVESVEGGKVSR